MRVAIVFIALGCSKSDPAPTAASAEQPVFDVEGFCEATLGVGRPCEGDDELLEGNKIGLCTTTLREARDQGATIDASLAPACIQAAKADKTLPDVRTLETLVSRFESCRKLLVAVPGLAKVSPHKAGRAKAGDTCATSADCAHGLYCETRACAPKKKAGASCAQSDECLGRCSSQAGKKCAAYCGSG